MAKRTFIRAYSDIVGGVGNDASICIGHEVSRNPSTMKLTSKDVSHSKRPAVEIRPVEARNLRRKKAAIQEEVGKTNFVSIDGDSTAANGNIQHNQQTIKAVPNTAYETRSFMSSVDLGPTRETQKHKTVNQHAQDVPWLSRNPEKPKALEDVRMFLPKGIESKDKPYVAPKFMPSYRDMMTPKPKLDPLVSILEPTPPSLQKWAIEWNAEPKHNISIAELREDIIREAAEKSGAPPKNIPKGPSTSGTGPSYQAKQAKQATPFPKQIEVFGQTTTASGGRNQAMASDSRQCGPCSKVQIPTENDPRGPKDPNINRSLGKPLIDLLSPRFITGNHLQNDEYSFKEAISRGMPVKTNVPNTNDKSILSILDSKVHPVHFDTEEQRFHKWFKERMSAAVQSVVDNQPTQSGNYHGTGQPCQPATSGISKLEYSTNHTNPNGQSQNIETEEFNIKSGTDERFTTSNGMTPPEVRNHPKLPNKAPNISHEPESVSSFFHWLQLRGHPIVKKENNPQKSNGSSEKKVERNFTQNNTKFPWSLSNNLRKKSSAKVIPKRLGIAKNVFKSHKSISQSHIGEKIKPHATDTVNRGIPKSLKKTRKTFSNKSIRGAVKKSVRSETTVAVGRSMNKIPKTDFPSEVDHVRSMRKTDAVAGSSKMKYWESKYSKKPKSVQVPNLSSSQTPDSRTKTAHNWYGHKKSIEGSKTVFNDSWATQRVENDRLSFSSIEEKSIPLTINGNLVKDQVMDFNDDFDIDGFLRKESVEEQLLNAAHESGRTPDMKLQVVERKEEASQKAPVKESIQFERSAQVRPEGAKIIDKTFRQNDDDLVMAFGQDPVREDSEWSEFIGPRNNLDGDADLTRILALQTFQISSEQNSRR